ncbi:MAG: hypothetical protein PWQ59_2394 [Thermoanaerobacterium sp.]|nr:hypothetical protein [Thermoanaerobacterium sp.]
MSVLWGNVRVPKRYIRINHQTIKKFPIFWELFLSYIDDTFQNQNRKNQILLRNMMEIGLTKETNLDVMFEKDSETFSSRELFPGSIRYGIEPINTNIPFEDLPIHTMKYMIDHRKEQAILDFLEKLSRKIDSINAIYPSKIQGVIWNSNLYSILSKVPEDNNELQEEDIMRYAPEIEFIQTDDFDEEGNLIFSFRNFIDEFNLKLDEFIERNNKLKEYEKSNYRIQIRNECLKIEQKIKHILERLDKNEIIDLSQL